MSKPSTPMRAQIPATRNTVAWRWRGVVSMNASIAFPYAPDREREGVGADRISGTIEVFEVQVIRHGTRIKVRRSEEMDVAQEDRQ